MQSYKRPCSRLCHRIGPVPFAVISARRSGWRVNSVASARRTSFFTIWSKEPLAPSPSKLPDASMSSSETSEEPSLRWREEGGEGDGSASCSYKCLGFA